MYDTTKVNTVRLWRTFVRAERVPMDTSGLCPEELYSNQNILRASDIFLFAMDNRDEHK